MLSEVKKCLQRCKHLLVISGAGMSAESGIPTFRGEGGFWRKWRSQDLATMEAFKRSPSLVWQFYHYRQELVLTKQPNKAHQILAKLEASFRKNDVKTVSLITQNVDELHTRAGSCNVIELHGSLFKTRCTVCGDVCNDIPVCPALKGTEDLDIEAMEVIDDKQLPRCRVNGCGGLLRPHIVWFGENLEDQVLQRAYEAIDSCDFCIVVGTSSQVYPAASFSQLVSARDVPVAEFNLESTLKLTPSSPYYFFPGPVGETLPPLINGLINE